jgi:hypothetical protein
MRVIYSKEVSVHHIATVGRKPIVLIAGKIMCWVILALSCVPTLALAQMPVARTPAASAPPATAVSETVLIPSALVPPIMQAILHPHSVDVGDILTLVQQLEACVADNPVDGAVRRNGPDQCPVVTQALAAQTSANAKKPTASGKPN